MGKSHTVYDAYTHRHNDTTHKILLTSHIPAFIAFHNARSSVEPHENRKVDKQPSGDTRRAKLQHDNSCCRATQHLRIPFSTSKQMTADMSEYFQSVSINTPCCNTYLFSFSFSFFARHSFLFRRTKNCSERTLKYRDRYMYLV